MAGIAGVVLAAGGSSRFGQPKQLLVLNRETLVHSAVRAARDGGCEIIYLVTGHQHAAIERAVTDLHPIIVQNPDWERGIGTSIRVGVRAVGDSCALVLLACDQPAVDANVVRSLIDLHHQTHQLIVACRYAGTVGIPTLFARSCFAEFQQLPDDQGAKQLIEADSTRVTQFDFPSGAVDLDLAADVESWTATENTLISDQ